MASMRRYLIFQYHRWNLHESDFTIPFTEMQRCTQQNGLTVHQVTAILRICARTWGPSRRGWCPLQAKIQGEPPRSLRCSKDCLCCDGWFHDGWVMFGLTFHSSRHWIPVHPAAKMHKPSNSSSDLLLPSLTRTSLQVASNIRSILTSEVVGGVQSHWKEFKLCTKTGLGFKIARTMFRVSWITFPFPSSLTSMYPSINTIIHSHRYCTYLRKSVSPFVTKQASANVILNTDLFMRVYTVYTVSPSTATNQCKLTRVEPYFRAWACSPQNSQQSRLLFDLKAEGSERPTS